MTVILGFWAVSVGLFDLRTKRIPNAALLLLLTPALLALLVNGKGLLGVSVASSLTGFLVGAAVMFPGYSLGKMGAGDVKFAGCIGLLLGLHRSIEWALLVLIGLGLMGLCWIGIRRQWSSLQDRLPAGLAMALVFFAEMEFGPMLDFFQG